jgi:hypothetical protein
MFDGGRLAGIRSSSRRSIHIQRFDTSGSFLPIVQRGASSSGRGGGDGGWRREACVARESLSALAFVCV